jgi:predicted membrane protein
MCLTHTKQQQIILGCILIFIWITSNPWLQSALNYFSCFLFWFVMLLPNILFLPLFHRNCYYSLYCDFILHSDLQTWPCS